LLAIHLSADLPVQIEPPAVLICRRCTDARKPSDEVGFGFVGVPGEMSPLVRGDKRPLKGEKIWIDDHFEAKGIDHPVDSGPPEVRPEQAALQAARFSWRTVAQYLLNLGERAPQRRFFPHRND